MSSPPIKTSLEIDIENYFYRLFKYTDSIEIRKINSRKLIEAIILYLYKLNNGPSEILEYNKLHPRRKLNEDDIKGKIDILVEINKFPHELAAGAVFVFKESNSAHHYSLNVKNQNGEPTYIDIIILALIPIVRWFLYEVQNFHSNQFKIDEIIAEYKKNHLNYSEKVIYQNNFDTEKVLDEIRKLNNSQVKKYYYSR